LFLSFVSRQKKEKALIRSGNNITQHKIRTGNTSSSRMASFVQRHSTRFFEKYPADFFNPDCIGTEPTDVPYVQIGVWCEVV